MDEAKLHEFMGKLVTDMGGAAMIANVILGEELGLYRAMADSSPITPEALATKTGCNPRLIREWLHAQAAAGYVEHVAGQFRLPPEQAMAPWRGVSTIRRCLGAPSASFGLGIVPIWCRSGFRPSRASSPSSQQAAKWQMWAADMACRRSLWRRPSRPLGFLGLTIMPRPLPRRSNAPLRAGSRTA